jgi:putative DNA-invertase from lambdoid prophage Rac
MARRGLSISGLSLESKYEAIMRFLRRGYRYFALHDTIVGIRPTKERYELGNNISSKVLAFAFSLSAEIERSMISSRTKEALARKKSEGKRLGRPKGKLSAVTKLSGKEDLIREYLEKKIPQSVIARLLNVNRLTVRNYIRTRKLQKPAS